MKNAEKMFSSESAEDILKFFASLENAPDLPFIDRLFIRQKGHSTTSHELIALYRHMINAGIIREINSKGKIGKGPNWTEPEFMKTKKYG